jgi:hypothetical protein
MVVKNYSAQIDDQNRDRYPSEERRKGKMRASEGILVSKHKLDFNNVLYIFSSLHVIIYHACHTKIPHITHNMSVVKESFVIISARLYPLLCLFEVMFTHFIDKVSQIDKVVWTSRELA